MISAHVDPIAPPKHLYRNNLRGYQTDKFENLGPQYQASESGYTCVMKLLHTHAGDMLPWPLLSMSIDPVKFVQNVHLPKVCQKY